LNPRLPWNRPASCTTFNRAVISLPCSNWWISHPVKVRAFETVPRIEMTPERLAGDL
jgi:hypothetical protein